MFVGRVLIFRRTFFVFVFDFQALVLFCNCNKQMHKIFLQNVKPLEYHTCTYGYIFISSDTVLILISLIQYHCLNYEIACKIFSTFDIILFYKPVITFINNKFLLYSINQKQTLKATQILPRQDAQ